MDDDRYTRKLLSYMSNIETFTAELLQERSVKKYWNHPDGIAVHV